MHKSDVPSGKKSESTLSTSSKGVSAQFNQVASSLIHSLQYYKAREGWKWYIVTLIPMIIQFWGATILPTLRNYHWGLYGGYIIDALNFPNTLLLHWLQYDAMVIIASILIGFVGCCYLAWIAVVWSVTNGHLRLFRVLFFVFGITAQTFGVFIVFSLVGFFDCSLDNTNDALERTLNRYSGLACFDSDNGIMIAPSVVAIIGIVVFVVASRAVTHSLHPLSTVPFTSVNSFVPISLDLVSLIGTIILYAIPVEYAIVSACINIALSLAFLIFVFETLPFFKIIDNAVYAGVGGARLGASIGALISMLTNSNSENLFGLEVGISVTCFLIVTGFLLCFCPVVIYLKYTVKQVRQRLLVFIIEMLGGSTEGAPLFSTKKTAMRFMESKMFIALADFKDTNSTGKLSSFFQLSCRSKYCSYLGTLRDDEGNDTALSDRDICSLFSKAFIDWKPKEVYLLLNLSLACGYDYDNNECFNCTHAFELLSLASKYTDNPFIRMNASYRIRELQTYSLEVGVNIADNNPNDNNNKVQQVKNNQDLLVSLQAQFFKEMLNDPIKMPIIEMITKKIADIAVECEQIFKELLQSNNNRTYLNMYATYVEIFQFNKELAQSLYMEGNKAEVETRVSQIIQKRKKSKIVPYTGKQTATSETSLQPSEEVTNDSHSSQSALKVPGDELNFDDSASVVAVEEPEQRKEHLFRNALQTPKGNGSN